MKENKKSVILFAGTTEGRQLAEYLQELDRPFVICVATGYGRDLLEDICRPVLLQASKTVGKEFYTEIALEEKK